MSELVALTGVVEQEVDPDEAPPPYLPRGTKVRTHVSVHGSGEHTVIVTSATIELPDGGGTVVRHGVSTIDSLTWDDELNVLDRAVYTARGFRAYPEAPSATPPQPSPVAALAPYHETVEQAAARDLRTQEGWDDALRAAGVLPKVEDEPVPATEPKQREAYQYAGSYPPEREDAQPAAVQLITERQVKYVHALGTERGYDHDQLNALAVQRHGVAVKQLPRRDASEFIDHVLRLPLAHGTEAVEAQP